MTNVERVDGTEFECDTVFPVDEELAAGGKWRMASEEEVSGWVGEEVSSRWRRRAMCGSRWWVMNGYCSGYGLGN